MDMAHKIIAVFGDMAKEIVLENPYVLMEKLNDLVLKNDAFALKIGIKENSIVRLKALITYVLQETLYSVGNSYIAKIDLYDYTVKYLGQDIDGELYDKVLENLASNKKIYIDIDKNIFDYKMYIQELELASELSKMLKGKRDLNQKC